MEPPPLLYLSEDSERSLIVRLLELDFKQRYDVAHWLEHSESPFKWMRSLKEMLLINTSLPDKLHDYKNQGSDYGFEKYCLLLSVMFMREIWEKAHSSDEESESDNKSEDEDDEYFPRKLLKVDPEKAYSMCKAALDEMAAHEGDVMYTRIGPAMEHVLQATRAQILYLNGSVAESKEIAAYIKPVREMSTENLAGIEAIKAKFTMGVYQDAHVPLEASRKAEEMDPTFAAWKYLTGKIIRRIRRDMKEVICEEELEHFKSAVDLERNPRFIVFLAQAYQEMALSVLKGHKGTPQVAEEMLDKAVDLYRECWSLKSDSAPIARRVGNGMMKMRGHHRDLHLTKEALLKAVELSPVIVTYHSLGKFYLDFEQDEEKALECFSKVRSVYGNGEIIRFNLIKSFPQYDPHDRIQDLIDLVRTVGILKRNIIYSDAGWYYLAYKNDLFMAVKFFWNILKQDFSSPNVMKFQSFAFCVQGPINMLEILVHEIKLLNINSPDCSMERKKISFLNQFSEKVYEKHPDLSEIIPNAGLLNQHKRVVEKYILSIRKRFKKNQQPFYQRRADTSTSWRLRESESVDNSSRMSSRYGRNCEEDGNRNSWNQEGMRRGGFSARVDNQGGYRDGMRFDRSREGMDSQRGNSRNDGEVGAMDVPDRRFEDRGRGSSRFHRDEEDMSWNQSRGEGRTTGNRRQYGHNSNRYDTTVTDWRSRSKE